MTAPKVQHVAYGPIPEMIAEYAALEMPQEWLDQNGFKFAVVVVADVEFGTEFCQTIEEAKACAEELAKVYGDGTITRV